MRDKNTVKPVMFVFLVPAVLIFGIAIAMIVLGYQDNNFVAAFIGFLLLLVSVDMVLFDISRLRMIREDKKQRSRNVDP